MKHIFRHHFTKLFLVILLEVISVLLQPSAHGQVVSGTTYNTLATGSLPTGWSGSDGGGTSYIKLIASTHYIKTADFSQNGFSSIKVKARKFGGPTDAQALITVSWYSNDVETVLGTIAPASTSLTDYTISAPNNPTANTTGYVKIQCKGASSSKGSGVSQVTITYTASGGQTTYTVSYDANGGTGSMTDTSSPYTAGATVTVKDNEFSKADYTFTNWNTATDGSGTAYDEGDTFTISENTTLYAQWTENASGDVLKFDFEDNTAHRTEGNNSFTNNTYTENGVTIDLTYADAVTTGSPLSGTANVMGRVAKNTTNSPVIIIGPIDISSWTVTKIDYYTKGSSAMTQVLSTSLDGSSWTTIKTIDEMPTSNTKETVDHLSITGSELYLKWVVSVSSSTGSNRDFQLDDVVITYETLDNPAPTISADDVNIAYGATVGAITYTINNEPVPAGSLTASVISGNWLSLGVVGATVPFTCTANPGYERESTVRLTYSYGVDGVVTKDVVITQAANPNAVDNISDITAAGTYKVKGTIVAKSQRGFIVGDGTGYVYYYNNTDFNPAAYSIGEKVKLDGTVSVYGGVFEFTNTTTISSVAESNYSAEDPTVLSGSAMDTRVASTTPAQLSAYVQYEGTLSVDNSHYNITNIDGASTAVGSISFPVNTDFTSLNGKIVRVKGYYVGISSSTYYNTMIESVEEVLVASVSVNPSTVNISADGGEGTISVSYNNFTLASSEVHFLQANGTTPANYDWITAEINGENDVCYHVDPYHGASDRLAYFNVYSLDGEANEYTSSLITVRQSAYVADYATLPFSFTEGKAAIAGKAGLSQTGLGSDYASAPLLRFDSNDDALVLRFNSDPGTLSFDIKGNGYSGSTFKVQTSVNGIDYTDLATYTELGDTENEEFTSIDSKVRYIRWIYSDKSGGNVALGNISLSKAPNPSSTIVLDATRSNGRYWVSFFDSESRYDLPDGAQAFTMNSSHELFLLGDDGTVIPKNTAVIIISNTSSITLTKGADTTVTINGGENILIGSDIPVDTLGLSGIPYVLGIKKGKLGFYMYTGSDIPANKAYYLE